MERHQARDEVLAFVSSCLFGPRYGDSEEIEGRIMLRYMLGILFPVGVKRENLELEEALENEMDDVDSPVDSAYSADVDNPLSLANDELPSSVGISLRLPEGVGISVKTSAAYYEKKKEGKKKTEKWIRRAIPEETIVINYGDEKRHDVFGGKASVRVVFREVNDGSSLATVTLLNEQVKDKESSRFEPDKNLFQVKLACQLTSGEIPPYPQVSIDRLSSEERMLEMQYNDRPPFAVGHGASASWTIGSTSHGASEVCVAYMPSEYVYRPVYDNLIIGSGGKQIEFNNERVFKLSHLSGGGSREEIVGDLSELCEFYKNWIAIQQDSPVSLEYESTKTELIEQATHALDRMNAGVALLHDDDDAFRAFTLANHAMLVQMVHAKCNRQYREKCNRDNKPYPVPWREEREVSHDYLDEEGFTWRPFQLAFLLLVIRSLQFNGEQDGEDVKRDRELADLIWFTTGGGKTEAYLLVAAYEMFRRRIVHGPKKGGGTSVINRYTYRFLTADQFSRTAGLVCGMEVLRRQPVNKDLGNEPFTVGLWAGDAVTPNRYGKALEKLNEIKNERSNPREFNAFQIEECPGCGTALIPAQREADEDGECIDAAYGFDASASMFRVYCPNSKCMFNGPGLPIAMIDDQLYGHPPSFLIGTIDKFANLPHTREAGKLLGSGTGFMPPTLIIQDELHLISGPLGTLAANYESAIDTIIYNSLGGQRHKVIASTATIQNAGTQARRLFARDVSIFPPRGISSDDAFFAREDRNKETARLYVGLMGQGIRSTVALYWACAAILQGVEETKYNFKDEEDIDFLWTLLCYNNSIREIGLVNSAVNAEIQDRIKVYASSDRVSRKKLRKEEISANAVKSVSASRDLLSRSYTKEHHAIDFVPCTNMISVGIDIDRLGLMVVNGQPKLTAEYIQATSRVGRKPSAPGLVFSVYSPSKPRDRSHYEQFRSYHSAIYRMVEPTSVTPGSIGATERSLHAAIVTAVRHASGRNANEDARYFDPLDAKTKQILKMLLERLLLAYKDRAAGTEVARLKESFQEIIELWVKWARNNPTQLYYHSNDNAAKSLLRDYESRRGLVGWPTMRSMRNVDHPVDIGQ